MTFQEHLKHYREAAGYESAKDFANKLGIKYTTYLAYESQEGREPKYEVLCRIAEALNVTPNKLLGYETQKVDEYIEICQKLGITVKKDSKNGEDFVALYQRNEFLTTLGMYPFSFLMERTIDAMYRANNEWMKEYLLYLLQFVDVVEAIAKEKNKSFKDFADQFDSILQEVKKKRIADAVNTIHPTEKGNS